MNNLEFTVHLKCDALIILLVHTCDIERMPSSENFLCIFNADNRHENTDYTVFMDTVK